MPALTLRLSDEQHEQIREAAFRARRSMHAEMLARLFGTLAERGEADTAGRHARSATDPVAAATPTGDSPGSDLRSLDVPRSASAPDGKRSYRPDPRGQKK